MMFLFLAVCERNIRVPAQLSTGNCGFIAIEVLLLHFTALQIPKTTRSSCFVSLNRSYVSLSLSSIHTLSIRYFSLVLACMSRVFPSLFLSVGLSSGGCDGNSLIISHLISNNKLSFRNRLDFQRYWLNFIFYTFFSFYSFSLLFANVPSPPFSLVLLLKCHLNHGG